MSYSLQEPDWPLVCECTYDEARDEMIRDDCPLHYDLVEPMPEVEATERKQSAIVTKHEDEAAA